MVQKCQLFPLTQVEHWTGLRQQFHRYLAQELLATRNVALGLAAEKVFDFISCAEHWPEFNFHGIRQINSCGDHLKFQSNCGSGTLTLDIMAADLQLDYSIVFDHEDVYKVEIRIVELTNGSCDLLMAITKPKRMPIGYFENKLSQLNENLDGLKAILEHS
jgi:hypothetical protein